MRCSRAIIITLTCLLISLYFVSVTYASYYYRNINYRLSIPNSNMFLTFDEQRTFDNFCPDNGTNTLFFDLTDDYTISSLTFSGSDCNVTVTEMGENGKLIVADVSGASSSNVNFTLGYSLPYLQYLEGNISNVDVSKFESNKLSYSVTGEGAATMKIHYPTGQTPYYLKINGVISSDWDTSGNTATVTDALGSTHTYELGFTALSPPTTDTDGGTSPTDSDETIQMVGDVVTYGSGFVLAHWTWLIVFAVFFVLGCVAFLVHKRNHW